MRTTTTKLTKLAKTKAATRSLSTPTTRALSAPTTRALCAPTTRVLAAFAFFSLALCALALAPAAGARRPQQQTAPPDSSATAARTKGTITVRVLGEDGQPVPGAFVTAFQQGSNARVSHDNSGAGAGRFVLTNLDAGVYRVMASAPGYVEEFDPAADAGEPRNLFRPGDSVTLRLTKGSVITGKVTDAAGEPVVGARVVATRLRDAAGRAVQAGIGRERRTDDRGVYRLYGLPSGTFVVFAGGRGGANFGARPSAYDADAPTYYPSATRDGAVEVQLQAGQELTDIDIRHRGERGHTISGVIAGQFGAGDAGPSGVSVLLTHQPTGTTMAFAFVSSGEGARSFSFDSLADGDYEVSAQAAGVSAEMASTSAPVRVSVRGADVTGLRLVLAPLATLAGRITFEPLAAADAKRAECQNLRPPAPQEALVVARREEGETPWGASSGTREASPAANGEFTLRSVQPGRYRLALRLLDGSLYARSITLRAADSAAAATGANNPNASTAGTNTATNPANAGRAGAQTPAAAAAGARGAASDLARSGVSLKSGDRVAGVVVTVGVGAAGLRGRVVAAAEGEGLPEGLRLHLVPAERERAEDVLRYAETGVRPDGSFALRNLAPGRYLLVARPAAGGEPRTALPARPLAWDAAARAELRREAEAAKNSVELQPCQLAEDFTVRFAPPGTN